MRLCGRVINLPCIRREIAYVSPPAPLREQTGAFSRHGDHQFLSPCPGAMLRLQTYAVRSLTARAQVLRVKLCVSGPAHER
jgi:hypothetical protein